MRVRSILRKITAPSLVGTLITFVQALGQESPQTTNPPCLLRPGDLNNMVFIPAGKFIMGGTTNEVGTPVYDLPQHQVILTSGFYLGKYEVTQGEYLDITGTNPSFFSSSRGFLDNFCRPVEMVSWKDATNYCHLLNLREKANGRLPSGWAYRLPSEAEWEYACRAGTTTAFSFGNAIRGGMANFDTHQEYDARVGTIMIQDPDVPAVNGTTTVGNYQPNAWGLYDMHGNVEEWTNDRYQEYTTNSVVDPGGPGNASFFVLRGGDWWYHQGNLMNGFSCRSAYRNANFQGFTLFSFGFRLALAPIDPEWRRPINTKPDRLVYSQAPTKDQGKDSLIIVTHGWLPALLPPDTSMVDTMSKNLTSYLTKNSLTNWQVHGHKWPQNARKLLPSDALSGAKGEGFNLGSIIATQGWTRVHLIGFSAGAQLIQSATEKIKALAPKTIVHCTFLDPFVGGDLAGVTNYGRTSDWSENYFSHDLTGGTTEKPLDHAYNIDITQLGPKSGISRFRSAKTGLMELCTRTVKYHGWSVDFYNNTITGQDLDPEYAGFGFALGKEVGGWPQATNRYHPGNKIPLVLGTPDPDCSPDIQLNPAAWPTVPLNFLSLPTSQSYTGSVRKLTNRLDLFTGSPCWVTAMISNTEPVNLVSFRAVFEEYYKYGGQLSVYWDTNLVGTIDERVIPLGGQSYSWKFPQALPGDVHFLGFRLDSYTNQTVIFITNLVLKQVGPAAFALKPTLATTNGLPIWELSGKPGYLYGIQASTDLVHWTDLVELVNTEGTVRFYDKNALAYPRRYYRGIVSE